MNSEFSLVLAIIAILVSLLAMYRAREAAFSSEEKLKEAVSKLEQADNKLAEANRLHEELNEYQKEIVGRNRRLDQDKEEMVERIQRNLEEQRARDKEFFDKRKIPDFKLPKL